MPQSDLDIRVKADATRAIGAILSVQKDLATDRLIRALRIAWHNGYEPVRVVVGRRLAHYLGLIKGMDARLLGMVPVTVDEDAEDGFGLVTRPPAREIMQDPQGGANGH